MKINAESYLEFIENQYFPNTQALARKAKKGKAWYFQQDDASSHAAKVVTAFIKKRYPKPFPAWPAKSPDLNVLDYFVWSQIDKNLEALDPPTTVSELRANAITSAAAIPQKMLDQAIDNLLARCKKRIEHEGGRFEYAL